MGTMETAILVILLFAVFTVVTVLILYAVLSEPQPPLRHRRKTNYRNMQQRARRENDTLNLMAWEAQTAMLNEAFRHVGSKRK